MLPVESISTLHITASQARLRVSVQTCKVFFQILEKQHHGTKPASSLRRVLRGPGLPPRR